MAKLIWILGTAGWLEPGDKPSPKDGKDVHHHPLIASTNVTKANVHPDKCLPGETGPGLIFS